MKIFRKTLLLLFFASMAVTASAQDFGFGGQQISKENMHYSEKFSNLNYADDGQAYHTLDIYLPEKKQDKYPVVIHIYGSAWFSNNGKDMADLGTICAALLKAGYAVVCPNHRASTDAKWPAQCHDIKAAIRYIRGNAQTYHLDPSFIAISGFSSGGHLASMMGATSGTKKTKVGDIEIDLEGSIGAYTKASSAVDCVVDWSGPIDLRRMDCAGKRDMSQASPEEVLLGAPLEGHDDLYRTLSPMTYLDRKDPPTVVFHGKKDNVVPFCQGHEFYNSLLDNGVKVRFYQEEEGGHGFKMYTDENLKHMTDFLADARKQKESQNDLRQNPIVQTCFTTDPAPMVSGDRMYVFTGHDEDNADFFWMQEWRVYSTSDMVNWQDHGSPCALETFSWADDRAWAPQCIERNGKYYLYVPAHSKLSGTMAIGVAVSDSPVGPFVDPIGKPLADGSWDYIDPTVFIDDDGQAWLYWGNPKLYYAKLNDDMITLKDGVHQMDMSTLPGYTEGPWIMKRNVPVMKNGKATKKTQKKYYLMYACGGIPERISYALGDSPVGPWEYKGDIMPLTDTGSFTNHAGLMDFRGHSYFFYHTGKLPGGGGFGRSVAVEEFKYNQDGTLPLIPMTETGVEAIATFNPYDRVQAETMAQSHGLRTQQWGDANVYVSDIHNGDWLLIRNVDFGNKALDRSMKTFTVSASSALRGGTLELRTDNQEGKLIASINIPGTGGWENFKTFSTHDVNLPEGVHNLYLVFKGRKGPELFTLDWWTLGTGDALVEPMLISEGAPAAGAVPANEGTECCKGKKQTYRNPVINADVPDISVCKVKDTYYMISTTMHLMPGAPIMKSKDMVNWETVSYVFDRIDDGERYDLLNNKTVYGQGQWASSIRYHGGKFYVWFTANGAPGKGFLFSADKAEGPWTLVARPPHMHDGSLFFDEDGRVYMFHETGHLTELDPKTFSPLAGGVDKQLFERDEEEKGALLEGSSVIKHNGKYYLCMISMKWGVPGRVRREVCYRADEITGPYTKHVILETPFETYGGVGQGSLVGDTESDKGWMALIFQDRGGIGRVPCAMPVTWVDGWPMCGELNEGVDGNDTEACLNPKNYHIPNDLSKAHPSVNGIIGSDEFNVSAENKASDAPQTYHERTGLSLYWQWNHNPVDKAWSLNDRKGFLRLRTSRVVENLNVAPNTLTQRMAGPECTGSVCLDVTNMKDGDICGLAAFNGDSGVLRIVKRGGKYVLQLTEENAVFKQPRDIERVDVKVIEEKELKIKAQKASDGRSSKLVYLQLHGDFNPGRDMAAFSYSLDGNKWQSIGKEVKMRFDYLRHFMGSKFAIFNYATKQTGGYVDVDWFHFNQ